jgi:hypothetical protein
MGDLLVVLVVSNVDDAEVLFLRTLLLGLVLSAVGV